MHNYVRSQTAADKLLALEGHVPTLDHLFVLELQACFAELFKHLAVSWLSEKRLDAFRDSRPHLFHFRQLCQAGACQFVK